MLDEAKEFLRWVEISAEDFLLFICRRQGFGKVEPGGKTENIGILANSTISSVYMQGGWDQCTGRRVTNTGNQTD